MQGFLGPEHRRPCRWNYITAVVAKIMVHLLLAIVALLIPVLAMGNSDAEPEAYATGCNTAGRRK